MKRFNAVGIAGTSKPLGIKYKGRNFKKENNNNRKQPFSALCQTNTTKTINDKISSVDFDSEVASNAKFYQDTYL